MKQLVVALLLVALGIYAAWQNRIELLVWAAPRVRAIVDPIPPNVPTNWLRGPVKASQALGMPPEEVTIAEVLRDASYYTAHNAQQARPLWPSVIDGPQLIDKTGAEPYGPGDEYIYWPN